MLSEYLITCIRAISFLGALAQCFLSASPSLDSASLYSCLSTLFFMPVTRVFAATRFIRLLQKFLILPKNVSTRRYRGATCQLRLSLSESALIRRVPFLCRDPKAPQVALSQASAVASSQ